MWKVSHVVGSRDDQQQTLMEMECDAPTPLVLYDTGFALEQLLEIRNHTKDTREALDAIIHQPPIPTPSQLPPSYGGCMKSKDCIRKCGPDGKHLKSDGTPGGRGQCCIRPHAFNTQKKRKKEDTPPPTPASCPRTPDFKTTPPIADQIQALRDDINVLILRVTQLESLNKKMKA